MLLSAASRPSIPVYLVVPTGLLLVAYLYALATRPPIPDHARVSEPERYGFPEWYGPSSSTPYDVKHGSGRSGASELCERPRSVLLFIDLPYGHPKIPHALDVLDTLEHDPNVQLTVVAPFQDGWRDDQRIIKNIEDAGCGEWVWRIGENVREPHGACANSVWISEIVSRQYGTMEDLPVDSRANVTVLPQPHYLVAKEKSYEALKESHGEAWEMGLFTHVLPYVDIHTYYPSHAVPSRKSVTYFPRRETPHSDYPALPWGRSWKTFIPDRLHPPPRHVGTDPLKQGSAYRRYWAKVEGRKAEVMRHAGVCLFEGWQEGILDERVVQAMLSGCVVATVQPEVHHDVLSPLIIPLSPPSDPSASLPVDELNKALSKLTNAELKRKQLHAFIYARQKFVPTAGVRAVFDATRRWEEGGRGYLFPNGWRWTCSTAGVKPPWCD